MTTRLLPPEEWGRLVGTELGSVARVLPPDALVLVVEDEGNIVGCWSALRVVHLEGLWIAPSHRKSCAVGRRLWTGIRRMLSMRGIKAAVTASIAPEIDKLLAHAGASEIPGKSFLLRV